MRITTSESLNTLESYRFAHANLYYTHNYTEKTQLVGRVEQSPPTLVNIIHQETVVVPFFSAHDGRSCNHHIPKASLREHSVKVEVNSMLEGGPASRETPVSPTSQHNRSSSMPITSLATSAGSQVHHPTFPNSFSQPRYSNQPHLSPDLTSVVPQQQLQGPPSGTSGSIAGPRSQGYSQSPSMLGALGHHTVPSIHLQPPRASPPRQSLITTVAKRTMHPHAAESPAKKQSKWSAEEDALIIELRGGGMKWEDISKRLPGRSPISCRLHYQNYLERRSEWDEERKNKLARLYER